MPNALFFIHALTDLHPGSGSDLGAVDLPIQRERHTQWPTISGSAIKGVVRDSIREKLAVSNKLSLEDADKQPVICELFGPPPLDDANDNAGALAFTDARILAFPVRSLRGTYALITCPSVLRRFLRDARLVDPGVDLNIPPIAAKTAKLASDTVQITRNNTSSVVLEEFRFISATDAGLLQIVKSIANGNDDLEKELSIRLALIHDEDFTYFVRYATTVSTRIRLDYKTKTVADKALFSIETLPPETVLYSVVLAGRSRHQNRSKASGVLASFTSHLGPGACVLQIGADETTGKGLCRVSLVSALSKWPRVQMAAGEKEAPNA